MVLPIRDPLVTARVRPARELPHTRMTIGRPGNSLSQAQACREVVTAVFALVHRVARWLSDRLLRRTGSRSRLLARFLPTALAAVLMAVLRRLSRYRQHRRRQERSPYPEPHTRDSGRRPRRRVGER
nr:hypothetical protein GCM10020241_37310 [Streptoalloteichus tenebrarius]